MSHKQHVRYGSWLVTSSLVAAGILFLIFSFLPTSRTIQSLRDEIRSDEKYIAQTSSLTLALTQTQANLDRTIEYSANWRQRLPNHATFPAILGRITKQADVAGASMTRIEPQAALDLDTLRVIPIVFAAKGSYVDISRLLAGLEGLPEHVWLEDVRLEGSRQAGQKMLCELRLVVFAGNLEISD